MKVEELFVPVENFEKYAVSNYGRVINLSKGLNRSFEINQRLDRHTNRMKVRFYINAAYMDVYVDELVTQAFFVEYHPGVEIFYKNHNRHDCTVLNLTFDPQYRE